MVQSKCSVLASTRKYNECIRVMRLGGGERRDRGDTGTHTDTSDGSTGRGANPRVTRALQEGLDKRPPADLTDWPQVTLTDQRTAQQLSRG